ncbi:MAG TPA: Fic family protein [Gemmatimonadaceae bacterium]|nr:Fic family protein [Gemmatimonadaceae bacterium]
MPPDPFLPSLDPRQSSELVRLVGELDEFKGHWRRVREIQAERLASLRQVATIESAASSTRIEGAELSDEEVARVLGGLHVDSFRKRDEEEVRGYGEVLSMIYESHAELSLTENHVRQLHGTLLRHTAKDERHRGEYKKLPNDVIASHGDGRTEVIFQTATPFDTPRMMAELVADTNAALTNAEHHPLVVIARFVVQFLAIHPFQDGNGRLSRALTTLLLLRSGYEYVPYASLERIVEENKLRYYAALRESQLAMRTDPSHFGAWLLFLLGALRAQKRSLESKLDVERSMLQLSTAQERILAAARTRGRVTTPWLVKELGIADRTIRYHLDLLVQRRLLAAHGEKRGRYYTPGGDEALPPEPGDPGTSAVLAEIYEAGGRISQSALLALLKRHGYRGRVVGLLHGRRLAHLRRDPKTKESVLTSRGQELARQHIFAARLARGGRGDAR